MAIVSNVMDDRNKQKAFNLNTEFLFSSLVSCLLLLTGVSPVWGKTELLPEISFQEKFVENNSSSLKDSGQVTIVTPSLSLTYLHNGIDLLLNYGVDAIYYNGLEANDQVNQKLNFINSITHKPDQWTSQIRANIDQENVSVDGVQLLDDTLQSSNLREQKTVGFISTFHDQLFNNLFLDSNLNLNYIDTEDESSAHSEGLDVKLSSQNSSVNWHSSIDSRITSRLNEEETVSTLELGLSYRWHQKFQTFLTASKSDTSNDQINETETTVGFTWLPNTNSSLTLGLGKRGSENTYTLDSSLNRRYLTFSINYSEQVTSSIQQLFDNEDDQSLTSSSVSQTIDPLVLKRGSISLLVTGKRSLLSLSFFDQSQDRFSAESIEEKSRGYSLNFTRTLSPISSLDFLGSKQENRLVEINTINDFVLTYQRQLGENLTFSTELRETEQESTNVLNEYKVRSLNFIFRAVF